MTKDFTDDERRLLVRAVAAYSDECQTPLLTPECPFFEMTETGPMCAEQCRDLIAENAGDLPRPETFSLGGALAAHRRRTPRHGPREGEPAFDAGQVRLEDRDKPVAQRRMTALMAELAGSFASARDDDTLCRLDVILDELSHRGVDIESLVRQGLGVDIRTGVFILMMGVERGNESDGADWVELLDELAPPEEPGPDGEAPGFFSRIFSVPVVEMLHCWIAHAPIEDLVARRPPVSPTMRRGLPASAQPVPDEGMTWFVDRFTETYLPSWSTSSLKLEWRYQHALRPGCVSAASMRERRIDKSMLASAISDAAVLEWEHAEVPDISREDRHTELNVDQFLGVALNALNDGRRDDAVGLYRSILELRRDDAEVNNNLGFCLLPDHPDEALSYLKVAANDESYISRATSLTNLALAHHMLGERELALTAIDAAIERVDLGDRVWMWPLDGPKDHPTDQIELLGYAEALRALIEGMS